MTPQAFLIGATTGLGYGLLACGLVLVYRATRVVNFAHAEIGLFGATLAALVISNYGINYWIGLLAGVAAGALWGAAAELIVIRRLARRAAVVLFIATVALAQVVFLATISMPSVKVAGGFPIAFHGPVVLGGLSIPTSFQVGGVVVQSRVTALLVIGVPAVLALSWFLNRTRYGLMIRASATAADTARLVGIDVRRMSTVVWTIAGGFAALTIMLTLPFTGAGIANASQPAGPGLLVRALVVALLVRMRSLLWAIVAGVGVGMAEAYLLRDVADRPGITEVGLLAILLLLVLRMRQSRRDDDVTLLGKPRPVIAAAALEHRSVRYLPRIGVGVVLGLLALVPLVASQPSQLGSWSFVVVLAMVATSSTILTGWVGQLSLGQYAFFGLGTTTMLLVSGNGTIPLPFVESSIHLHLPFVPALVVAATVTGVVAALVGLPALRTRGLFLAVLTLAFAVAMEGFILRQAFWTDGRPTVPRIDRPSLGPVDLTGPTAYYLFLLVLLALTVVMSLHIRRTGSGRVMVATRDNPDALATATVSTARTKLTAFAFSGVIAGSAGALYAAVPPAITLGADFPASDSLRIVAVAIVGGLGSVTGAIIGALWVFGLPLLFRGSDTVALLTSGVGMLVLLLYAPGGLMQLVDGVHTAVVGWLTRRDRRPDTTRRTTVQFPRRRVERPDLGTSALAVRDLSVTISDRRIVDGVDLDVAVGEIVGLIGTNGAGKTTVMNAVTGSVPSSGHVSVLGRPVDGLPVHRRFRAGMGRTFQTARLYPGLTVRETVLVALEARERARFVSSLLATPPSRSSERRKRSEADEIISFVGLGRFADTTCADLSTGTRRIVELGQLLASEASTLLLDEPTGGVAQREAEAFGPLLQRIRDELRAGVLLIEHDMPLVMSISERIYCLELGKVIAEGPPGLVRADPAVIASYLGVDERAIARSTTSTGPGRPHDQLAPRPEGRP